MYRLLGLALCPALAAVTMLASAQAQEISSVYTPLDLRKCKDVTPEDAKEYGTIWRCEGYEGIQVRVAEGDLSSDQATREWPRTASSDSGTSGSGRP